MLNPDLFPSLTWTLLTPLGDYPATWLTGERALYAGADGWLEFLRPHPGGTATILAIALLLLLSVPPLALAPPLLRRRNLSA